MRNGDVFELGSGPSNFLLSNAKLNSDTEPKVKCKRGLRTGDVLELALRSLNVTVTCQICA